ncbi:MAG: UDP-glucose 4-epimerase GalE [Acidobacteriota bacterium]|jgi:UDP-glucose-4-epimerase GalE
MQGILVTGGAGYIGSCTLRVLQATGYLPICLDNLSTGYREFVGVLPLFQGDLEHDGDLDAAFAGQEINAVIHFAAHALVEESCRNPHKYYHDNILNTLNLLEAMRRHQVSSIVFSSSCATYGIPARVPIDESTPLDPINPYGVTKMVIERILRDYQAAHGFRCVSLRYFNAAGAAHDGSIGEWHVPETHIIPRLLEIAQGNGSCAEIYGNDYPTPDGTCIRDYIHVLDLAHAHVAALEYLFSGRPSATFNLGTGHGCSVLQVLDQVRRTTGKDVPATIKARRSGDPPALVANPERAKAGLGWSARHSSLAEIVETAWKWRQGAVCQNLAAKTKPRMNAENGIAEGPR